MVNVCAVFGCNVTSRKNKISFFGFPRKNKRTINCKVHALTERRRLAWYTAIKRADLMEDQLTTRRICAKHFITGKPAELFDETNPDWVPTLHLGYSNKVEGAKSRLDRWKRNLQRNEKKHLISSEEKASTKNGSKCERNTSKSNFEAIRSSSNELQTSTNDLNLIINASYDNLKTNESSSNKVPSSVENSSSNLHSQNGTVVASPDANTFTNSKSPKDTTISPILLLPELQKRNDEVYRLREELAFYKLDEPAFRNDDEKLCFYTGLPDMSLFSLVLEKITPSLQRIRCDNLTTFQKLMLTLMKLRYNLSFVDLGYRFGISCKTASRIFGTVIVILYTTFKELVQWPDREALSDATPACFRETFGDRVSVIIHSFEISPEKSHTLQACNQTLSIKYLIGLTPHGIISFISHGYGGGGNDEFVTEDSGILNHLQPEDIVLTDCGFTINELVAAENTSLKIPDFVQRLQLEPRDVEGSKKKTNVRLHVQRMIEKIHRKYEILNGPIDTTLLNVKHDGISLVDIIVHVCCVMVNLCDSVLPLS